MLYKIEEFVDTGVLKLIYHAVFNCHLNCANTVCGQNKNSLNCLFLLQKEMFIQTLFSVGMNKIVNLHDKIIIENWLFISKSINFDLPWIFSNWFTFSSDSHRYETSCSLKGFSKVRNVNINKYGREALINSAISSWNDIQKYFSSNKMLRDVPTFKLKSLLKKHLLVNVISTCNFYLIWIKIQFFCLLANYF